MLKYLTGFIILFMILSICLSCSETVATIIPSKLEKPVSFGSPSGKNYKVVGSFSESFWTLGGSDADNKIHEICNEKIKEYNGDGIMNFSIKVYMTYGNMIFSTYLPPCYYSFFTGNYWVTVAVYGEVIKLDD